MNLETLQKKLQTIFEAAYPQYFDHSVSIHFKIRDRGRKEVRVLAWCRKEDDNYTSDNSFMVSPSGNTLNREFPSLKKAVNAFLAEIVELKSSAAISEETFTEGELALPKKEVQNA